MLSEHEVFTEALTLSDAAARTAYLDRVCGTDSSARVRLNELLELHARVDSVLEKRPQEIIESLSANLEPAEHDPEFMIAALKPYLEPPSNADSIGKLSHYELLEILGQGGYGIVFKALDSKLHRMVAIKILSPLLAATSPPRRRFLREARAAAAVRHEHVVQIYAVEEVPIPYLVMEFVSGETLQQLSDRLGPFEPAEVVRLGQQIARGLAAAHESGLIHRDIKPGNILIEAGIESVAKLSDFGLARSADDASRSQSGIVVGTPMYMSPEQVRGEEVDQRTDLFSFGSVLYLMAAGRPPFRAPNTLAVLKRVAEDKPRSVRDVIPEVPEGLNSVVARLHSKSRQDRYATAKEVANALASCLTNPPRRRRSVQPVLKWIAGHKVRTAMLVLFIGVAGLFVSESAGLTNYSRRAPNLERVVISATGPAKSLESKTQNLESKLALASPGTAPPTDSQVVDISPANASNMVAAPANASVPVAGKATVQAEAMGDLSFLTDWDREVSRMPPEEQAKAVREKLKQLSPDLDVSAIHMVIEDDAVRKLLINPSNGLVDISPLRALRKLTEIRLVGTTGGISDLRPLIGMKLEVLDIMHHPIRDLSPLRGMPLKSLGLWPWEGEDISPLRGMALTHGNFGGGAKTQNFEPLRGMPFEMLCLNHSNFEDLSVLAGMPLKRLEIQNTKVTSLRPIAGARAPEELLATEGSPITDFTPLRGSKLSQLTLSYDAARDEAVLRSLPSLQTVNGKNKDEFLSQAAQK